MAKDTRGDEGPASSRGAHRCDENGVDDLFEGFFLVFVLVPSALVQVLPQQLDWGLGTVLLLGRHIEVINKEDAVLLGLWAVLSLTNFVKLAVNDILGLHRGSLRGETQLNRHVLLSGEFVEDVVFDVD